MQGPSTLRPFPYADSMVRPLVSIVLPVLNGQRYLRQSIESCLCQSYDSLELVIVDDGSTDLTPAIIDEYLKTNRPVRRLSHACNRGLPEALNTGFGAAAGQFLTWTSDDNYYRPHAIEKMLEVLEGDASVDVVYSDYSTLDSVDRFLRFRTAGDLRQLLSDNHVGPCFLYRRKVQEVLGKYDKEMALAEDYDFWLRASARFRMVPIHQDLYCFRDHRHSLGGRFKERVEVMRDQCLLKNMSSLTWATRSDKAAAYVMLARRAQLRGEWRRAWDHLSSAFRLTPPGALAFIGRKILNPSFRGGI